MVRALTPEQQSEMAAWRAIALERMPYMAAVLFSLRPLDDPGLHTFAVDSSWRLYVDFDSVASRGVAWCAEALLHECGHLIGDHAARADAHGVPPTRRQAWNLATDAEINDDLAEAGCSTVAASGVLPEHLGCSRHDIAEHYYDSPSTSATPDHAPSIPSPGGGSGDGAPGDGQGGSSPGDGSPAQSPGSPGQDGSGLPAPQVGCGSGAGGVPVPGELADADDAGGAAPAASGAERHRVQIAVAAAVRQAVGRSPGSVPGGLVTWAESVLTPSKLPWRTLLSSAIRRAIAMRMGDSDVTYLRRSRRNPATTISPGRRVINPGRYSPRPTLAVVRDTSGSMSDEDLSRATVEVEGIARQIGIRGDDLVVLDTDVEVAATRRYKGAADLAQAAGRGGTDMGAGLAAALSLRPRPNAVVIITDGYTPWPPERPSLPVVVCLVAGAEPAGQVPEWATVVVVEDD